MSGGWDSVRAQAAEAAFCIRAGELAQTAASFRFDIEQGLKNKDVSSLRMLPSYTALPDGGNGCCCIQSAPAEGKAHAAHGR